jgi:hypothetical protein
MTLLSVLLFAVAAAILIPEFRRARTPVPAQCRACGHRLAIPGPEPGSAAVPFDRCPECNASTAGRGTTHRLGVRRGRVVITSSVLIVALAGIHLTPSRAWRITNAPPWWLVHVERRFAPAAAQPTILASLVERRRMGELDDRLLDALLADLIARLQADDVVPPGGTASWFELVLHGFDGGRLSTTDLVFLHEQFVSMDLSVTPSGPTDARAAVIAERSPRLATVPDRVLPAPAGRTAVLGFDALRINGTEIPPPPFTVRLEDVFMGEHRPVTPLFQPAIPADAFTTGPLRLELDVRISVDSFSWTRTVAAEFEALPWPPAAFRRPADRWLDEHVIIDAVVDDQDAPTLTVTIEPSGAVRGFDGWDLGRSIAEGVPGLRWRDGSSEFTDDRRTRLIARFDVAVDAIPATLDVPLQFAGVMVHGEPLPMRFGADRTNTIEPRGRVRVLGPLVIREAVPVVVAGSDPTSSPSPPPED